MSDPNPDFSPEAIAEALRQATPGPWDYNPETEDDPRAGTGDQFIHYDAAYGFVRVDAKLSDDGNEGRNDAHLIANAPTWLAQLLAIREAKDAQIERLNEWARGQEAAITSYEAALEAKDGEVERLRVAWQRSLAMLRAAYPHPDHVPLVVERVIDMMAAALAPSTPTEDAP